MQDEKVAPATVDGMLGGYGFTSADEMAESIQLLRAVKAVRPALQFQRAVGTWTEPAPTRVAVG